MDLLLGEFPRAADVIFVECIAAINDDVTGLEVRNELFNKGVDGRAGLDEEDDLAGALELLAELLNGPCADDVGACERGEQR